LWPFVQMSSKHTSPELTNFLWHFPADSYLKHTCTTNRHYSTVYLTWGMLLHHWRTEKCIYQQQARWFIAQVCYHRQLKLQSSLKTVR
jgi:DNA polymerase IIIc chi subunit